jgi:AsmA-like C-terminal region/Protein of unknown function
MQYAQSSLVVRGSTDLAAHQVRLSEGKLVLADGTKLAVAAVINGIGTDGPLGLSLQASYDHLGFDALKDMWPETIAVNPREWILANISRGMIKEGNLDFEGEWNPQKPDDVEIKLLTGKFKAEGLTVNYLTPMTPLQDAWGNAHFNQKEFRVDIEGGHVGAIKLNAGTAVFSGLDQSNQFAAIEGTGTATLATVLRLIDQKPLGYAHVMGFDPNVVNGMATTRLALKFPLLKELPLEDLAIKVHSDIEGAAMPKVFAGLDLTQGKLGLDLDGKGMDVTGPIVLGGIGATLKWRENFSAKAPYRSLYVVQTQRFEARQLAALGLDFPPFNAPWLEGPLESTVTATMNGHGRTDVDVVANLSAAKMAVEGLSWHKEAKTTGEAKAHLVVDGNRIAAVSPFDVVAGDLKCDGSVEFDHNGHAKRVDFRNLSYGRSLMQGSMDIGQGGALSINVRGPSFDASNLISSNDQSPPKNDNAKDQPVLGISAQFKHGDWRTVKVRAKVGDGAKDFQFDVSSAGAKLRHLNLVSADAGAAMKAFDVYNDLVGGALVIEGQFDDSQLNQPLSGTIHITDFNVVNTPALARLLNIASLTGVVDLLKGDGVSFSTLEAPFVLSDGLLKFKDAHTSGNAIGLTANGEIDMDRSRLKMDGTLVPFYALNSALGGVPVLGWLLNGGEKGGGVVAFNFSMKGPTDEPEVRINPLSALTPGFLRHLFDVFGEHDNAVRKAQ